MFITHSDGLSSSRLNSYLFKLACVLILQKAQKVRRKGSEFLLPRVSSCYFGADFMV